MRQGETTLKRKWFSLTREVEYLVIDDWFDQVKLEHHGDPNSGYHTIKVDGL